MKSLYQQESDKQMEMAWAKMDLQAKLFLTNAQYNDTVFDAFIATCRVVFNLPFSELVRDGMNQKLQELLAQVRKDNQNDA